MSQNSPQYIIAIGASAGGMEEIHRFFDNTPLDSVSYVIVQHLSPDFKSRMVELLAKHSKLKVTEAEHDMRVELNQVYFIPNKKVMTIQDGKLLLTEKEKIGRPFHTINTFFNSLAAERGNKAIGIILSGTGSDGSEGIKAIKEAGGMIIVSNPDHAEYNGMPANAIATGIADFVLEPEAMPQTIQDYVHNNATGLHHATRNKNESNWVRAIIDLIKENLPLDFSDYKENTIIRRIKRRAASHNFVTLENYFTFLKNNIEEVKALAQDFLISVTSFFRDKEAFAVIEAHVIPDVIRQAAGAGDEIKIWVTGCATGEEAYSLAIILREQLDDRHKNTEVKIFATDIDAAALSHAGKGIYSENITKDISPQRIERFFNKESNQYSIKPEIRRMLIFARHDLTKNPPYCNMNLISCRNLLIYLTPALQKKIFIMLQFGLKKDGYLFLGSSENVHPLNPGLHLIDNKFKIYKNIETKRAPLFDAFSLPAITDLKPVSSRGINGNYDTKKNDLYELLNEAITNDLGYTAICIDENNQVVKTFGDTSKFFLQKNFNLNLTDLLPAPLATAFNTARRHVLQSDEGAIIKGIEIKNNGQQHTVNLRVKPLPARKGGLKLFYVLINEDQTAVASPAKDIVFNPEIFVNHYITDLEQELRDVKEKLQLTSDNLDASVENMQSFNEELLSANEEMQSTNEEMQSVNEELQTINSDYQLKNKELAEINDDLNNYFKSNLNGQLFVNTDLLLMKFSPGTVKHINLLDTDIGRPISNISTNLRFETIENDIKEVIANGGLITKEVEATNGKSYQLMTMPYVRQADNKNVGAIITFNDITELKKIQRNLDETNKNLMRVNGDLDNFVHAASHDLLGPLSNIEASISMLTSTDCASDQEVKEYITVINESIRKFKNLVKEMATIGKIENQMSETELVDFAEIIDEIKLSIADKINLSKAVITTDLDVPQIRFSKKNLRSILYNIIVNAIKYKRPERDPVIIISTAKANNYDLLSIKDNGSGIAKDKLEKIFNIYGRIQTDVEGQGIGLYLAKKIVDAAGGHISVDSEPGKGSTFNVYFKSEKESPAARAEEQNVNHYD